MIPRPRPRPSFRRRVGAAGIAGLASLGLLAGVMPTASARPSTPIRPSHPVTIKPLRPASPVTTPRLSSEARAVGVEAGNAPMGWRNARVSLVAAQRSTYSSSVTTAAAKLVPMSGVLGIDVASYQRTVNWASYKSQKRVFAYVKATEGTSYRNPYFRSQYDGAAKVGIIRGAYHFANPSGASGKAQADFFVNNGGGWRADGKTLPGVLDIEYNPYGGSNSCYGLSKTAMVTWITDFLRQYKARTKRDAVIYTTADWWRTCTGDTTKFNRTNPLWVARYGTPNPGTLPGKWPFYTFWQYSANPIDQNRFSSSYSRLQVLARGR